jgi:hypothetical protein
MDAIKTHKMDRGRCRGMGHYHPMGGMNTTDKLNIKRHPTIFGGGSAGTTIGGIERVSGRMKNIFFFAVLPRGNRHFACGGEVTGQTLSFFSRVIRGNA